MDITPHQHAIEFAPSQIVAVTGAVLDAKFLNRTAGGDRVPGKVEEPGFGKPSDRSLKILNTARRDRAFSTPIFGLTHSSRWSKSFFDDQCFLSRNQAIAMVMVRWLCTP